MNKTNLKRYAPQARKDFIAAVTARANLLGLSERAGQVHAEPAQVQGDVALIGGRPWPASVQGRREQLLHRMRRDGYAQTLEAVAYTWFNRLAALRYMELHDYLGHGRRVLSNPEGGLPEVLTHALALAEAGDLPGLGAAQVRELKLANQDGELYRRALIAQCNALHQAMPFLFEALDDETELLLPDNLLLSDAIVAKLVAEIPEEDWAEVEVIGWLYQFYISEKKDQVIGKVVKSEDIPAATQLFTPNWIVQYLVQNSVGRLWLMANPTSTLASQWPYYIQPAEQTPEVQAQLDALIQIRIREDGEALNPETITVLDPACGSGHILVVAYDVLKAIYLERGYQPRAIPRLILEKNLYGLDIDDRAAQLAAFALLMKARADDRRLLNDLPKLNVLSLQESKGLDAGELATHLAPFGLQRAALKALVDTFEHAKTFGSLIQIPAALNGQLAAMVTGLQKALRDGDLYARQSAKDVLPLVWQALVLGTQFDAVVANPPYMGPKGMNAPLKEFAQKDFPDSKSDLYAMFIERAFSCCKPGGFNALIAMHAWMFLSSFQTLREKILLMRSIENMAHLGARAFPEISGEVVQTAAFVMRPVANPAWRPSFFRLIEGGESDKKQALLTGQRRFDKNYQSDFGNIPGSPIAYWIGQSTLQLFAGAKVSDISVSDGQNITANNDRFVRFWWEVDVAMVGVGRKWLKYCKGGEFRKWYGNLECVVNWSPEARAHFRENDRCRIIPEYLWYKPGITWSRVSSKDSPSAFRVLPIDATFDKVGSSIFVNKDTDRKLALGILNSKLSSLFIPMLNPTIDLQVRDVRNIPFKCVDYDIQTIVSSVDEAIELARRDWNDSEASMEFESSNLASPRREVRLRESWCKRQENQQSKIGLLHTIEENNNRILIAAYGLQDELAPEVPEGQITLARADREKDCQRLISYAVGCMMGRYSLDEPGLIYAHAGNVGFDPSRYEKKFPADADGILPITEEHWFEDDAASRVREFLRAVWGAETLEENMAWLAESLGTKGSETPDETIRRYLADKFFKDHLQTYKKRPIYWLFSSGKQGAFQALVYLHRYHEGTLARLRAEYVLPLTGKMQARIESLQADLRAAASTAARTKLNKQLEALKKQQLELLAYDEKLRHHADMRISLDLDDGVKVNYGKFGDLLAEVKAITGGTED